jgi:hypothetical protein
MLETVSVAQFLFFLCVDAKAVTTTKRNGIHKRNDYGCSHFDIDIDIDIDSNENYRKEIYGCCFCCASLSVFSSCDFLISLPSKQRPNAKR